MMFVVDPESLTDSVVVDRVRLLSDVVVLNGNGFCSCWGCGVD